MTGKDLMYDVRVENEVLRRHTDVLVNLARRAADRIALDDFLQELAAQVAESLEIDHVKVLRYRAERGDLFAEAGVGWRAGVIKTTAFPVEMASPPGRAFLTGQPVNVKTLDDEPEMHPSRVLVEHGIVSLLNVPVTVDGASWGVLEADSSILRGFSPDTLNFLVACAALAGLVIRRAQAEEAQAKAAADTARETHKRGLLLEEMQHRVKNNFQMIMALIALQMKNLASEQSRRPFRQLSDKILAMSLAHDQLSPTKGGQTSNLRTYLQALATSIVNPLENVTIDVEAEDMPVSIDQAVPLGLIVNEAVTNAFKHAFDPERGGAVKIHLRPLGFANAELTISDNGKGVGGDDGDGSGTKLMEQLAKQLRGRAERESSTDGTRMTIVFPRSARTLRDERAMAQYERNGGK